MDVLLGEIGIDPDVAEPLVDPATGESYAFDEDDRSAAAFTRDVEGGSGDVVLVDCRQDPDTDTIVGVTNVDSRGEDDSSRTGTRQSRQSWRHSRSDPRESPDAADPGRLSPGVGCVIPRCAADTARSDSTPSVGVTGLAGTLLFVP